LNTFQIIGRKYAFNITLFLCSIFAIATGGSPNYISVCALIAIMAFAGGGNLILDTAVYLEFLPGKYQWSLTFMAAWWGVGQMVAGLVAWPFLANYSCTQKEICTNGNNSGWRYTFYTLGSIVFILSILRITVIRLKESPKWLLSQNRDAEVVRIIHGIAQKAGKECSLTLEQLESVGTVAVSSGLKKYHPTIILAHVKGTFLFKIDNLNI
jgi:MFS family permease